ncbi:TPA: hypothetical protein I8024_000156 [Legionella pneumophila]|nr:hypothetical protein [Legionella pneumophila]HAT2122680.1 hypothetical protein [Legionella pneumophila]
MSFEFIRNKIKLFLQSDRSEVLSLYGAWGVGKTHTWHSLIKDQRLRISKSFKSYSYVSLFGIRSIEQLKSSIFENMVDAQNIGEKITSFYEMKWNLFRNLENKEMGCWNKLFLWLSKYIPLFSNWSKLKYLEPFVGYVIGISIRDAVICFDDIERTSDELGIDQILGYINFLKEERNCKIVIIGNEKKINDGKFKELNEKVIDKRLELSLLSEECCELIIPKERPYRDKLFRYICHLQLKNMRIISIIDGLTRDLIEILPQVESETWDHVIKNLCLFCVCQYVTDQNIPSLDFLLQYGEKLPQLFASAKKGEFEAERLFLNQYNFHGFVNVDYLIADGVLSGFFKDREIIEAVKSLDAQIKEDKQREASHSIWESFHNGFANNADEVISDLKQGYYKYKKIIGIRGVDAIIFTLNAIEKNDFALEICEDYINYLREEKIVVNESTCYYLNQLRDAGFIKALEEMSNDLQPQMSLHDAIDYISHNNGWSQEHVKALEKAEVNEYCQYFKTLRGDAFTKTMRGLSVFKSNNNKDSYKIVSDKIHFALKEISKESSLNYFRIELLGYNLKETNQ